MAKVNKDINLTKKDLGHKAEKKEQKTETLEVEFMFADAEEKDLSKKIIKRYLAEYDIETPADKMLIKQLVNLEVIQARLQKQMNETSAVSTAVHSKTLDTLHKNLSKIIDITEKLGITKEKRDATKTDGYLAWEDLTAKVKKWAAKNQLSRTSKCPHCQKYILWKRRVESWEQLKHPYLKDSMLINEHLLKLVGQGTISPKDYVTAMGTSEDFFYWLVPKLSAEDREEFNLNQFLDKGEDL